MMRWLDKHAGPVGGFLLGAGAAMSVEIAKGSEPTAAVVVGVAALEVVAGLWLLVRYARR